MFRFTKVIYESGQIFEFGLMAEQPREEEFRNICLNVMRKLRTFIVGGNYKREEVKTNCEVEFAVGSEIVVFRFWKGRLTLQDGVKVKEYFDKKAYELVLGQKRSFPILACYGRQRTIVGVNTPKFHCHEVLSAYEGSLKPIVEFSYFRTCFEVLNREERRNGDNVFLKQFREVVNNFHFSFKKNTIEPNDGVPIEPLDSVLLISDVVLRAIMTNVLSYKESDGVVLIEEKKLLNVDKLRSALPNVQFVFVG